MCGIVGQFSIDEKTNLLSKTEELSKMLESMIHRGPDGEGKYESKNLIMGMRRLSILDLDNGFQPIFNEDKSIVVVFNGEIYNYIEIKDELLKKGHKFYTSSDTEVLVHLYEEYGEDFSSYLNGMFSYTLFDIKNNVLIVSRDRVGEKPLYYSIMNDIFYFSSEIKSLLLCSDIKCEANKDSINDMLTFNYVPYPNTAFKNIYRLEPGKSIIIKNNKISKKTYWEIPKKSIYNNNFENFETLDSLISNSVEIRMRSDVEVGAFLSGGIDSTIVTKYMREKTEDSFKTFSIGFTEEIYNELDYAKKVSETYNTNHIYKIVNQDDFLEQLVNSIWFCENPHGDVSFAPTFILSELASKYLKVVLTGDGGDEIFGGYDKYLDFIYNQELDINENFKNYFNKISVFNILEKESILSKEFKSDLIEIDSFKKIEEKYIGIHNSDFINKIMYFDSDYLLEGNNLVKPDRMGMANSIEGRYPLLDYRIIEMMFNIDSSKKIYNGEKKYLLKNILSKDFDDDFIKRKKQMFTVPIGEWFKDKEFIDKINPIICSEKFKNRGIFNYDRVLKMIQSHQNSEENYTRQLRAILVVELWYRIYIDNKFTKKPSFNDLI